MADTEPVGEPEIKLTKVPSGKDGKFSIGTHARDERGGRGYQMAEPSPYVEQWAQCYNGKQPLMDIGCAYGMNTEAAVKVLDSADDDASKVKILAADFDSTHLQYVNNLKMAGVSTVHCKLPMELPVVEVERYGGLSGILVSEVLHFLTGSEIESSLSWFYSCLIPGGKVFITACSPYMGGEVLDKFRPEMLAIRREGLKKGLKWPLSPDDSFTPLFAWCKEDSEEKKEIDEKLGMGIDISSFWSKTVHMLEWELVDACRDAGFQVVEAKLAWREGYHELARGDGREGIRIIARKPNDDV